MVRFSFVSRGIVVRPGEMRGSFAALRMTNRRWTPRPKQSGLKHLGFVEGEALCVLAGDGDGCGAELAERPGYVEGGVVPEDAALAGGVVAASCLIEDFGGLREDEEAVGEALGNPEEFEFAFGVTRLQVKAGPLAEVRRISAEVDGDVPDAAGEDTHELPLRLTDLVMETAKDTLRGKRLVILRERVGQTGSAICGGIEDFCKPAALIAMAFGLNQLYVTQRRFSNLHPTSIRHDGYREIQADGVC
jgi:hypothetical protein